MKELIITALAATAEGILLFFLCLSPAVNLLFKAAVFLLWLITSGFLLFQLSAQNRILLFLKKEAAAQRKNPGQRIRREEEEERQLKEQMMELRNLQSQINPHFLYNTLDSIRSKALLEGQQEIADMTAILADFFRYCISNHEMLVRVEEELKHIQDYYAIQKFRFEDRFEMKVVVNEEDIHRLFVPRMTLQPLVENAMMHGIERVNRKGIICIELSKVDQDLVIIVSDNGSGMSDSEVEKMNRRMESTEVEVNRRNGHSGIAVTNVNARIKLIFGREYGIRYSSVENVGTNACVRMPLVDDFERVRYEQEKL